MNPAQARKGGLASPEASWRCSFFRAVKSYWFGCLLSHNHQTVKRSVNLPAGEKKKQTKKPTSLYLCFAQWSCLSHSRSSHQQTFHVELVRNSGGQKKKKRGHPVRWSSRLKRFPLWSHEAEGDTSLRSLERRNRALLKHNRKSFLRLLPRGHKSSFF